jgi:hypothetical protein
MNNQGFNAEQIKQNYIYPESKNHLKIKSERTSWHRITVREWNTSPDKSVSKLITRSLHLTHLRDFSPIRRFFPHWAHDSSFVGASVIGRLYSVQYRSLFGAPDKVRCNTCDKARPLSQVWGVEPNTSSGYEVAEPPHHHHIIARMQDCIPT